MTVRRCWTAVGAAWALSVCGLLTCSDATRPSQDAGVDGSVDASSVDGVTDKTRDGGRDVTHLETLSDARRDAPRDATVDELRDAPLDATFDRLHDAPGDGLHDAPGDTSVDAGLPSLVALSVSEPWSRDSSPPSALVPPFSPNVHDYYVRCTAGTNKLTVSMTASDGATSLLVQPPGDASAPQQTLSVSVSESKALIAAATDGTAINEYWVRCLPHDFPLLRWTPHVDAGTRSPGYYLLGTAEPTSGCYSIVLDGNGVPVWYLPSVMASDGWCVFNVDNIVRGAITFDSVSDVHAEFQVHQLAPLITTAVAPIGNKVNLHELRALANGDYLVISSPQETVDLTGMQLPLADGGVETLTGPQTILGCNVVEFTSNDTVVWTWTGTDHLDAAKESVAPVVTSDGSILLIDPFHCDSVDVDPANGNLLVSARQMNSVFYVDRATGKVLWKMGGTVFNRDGAAYVSVADPFIMQHDARLQPDWSAGCKGSSGHVSLFDDETGGTRPARGVVYDIVVGANDAGTPAEGGCGDAGPAYGGSTGTATVSWQYQAMVGSPCMGSLRISPDGARVIGWGFIPGAGFTEVDSSGNDVLDFAFSDGNTSYRVIKVPLSAFDLDVLRATAGIP